MGIQIGNAASQPAIAFDRVHLLSLTISQPVFIEDSDMANYIVELAWRVYGVMDGKRYYKEAPPQSMTLPNYIATAMEQAQKGDMTLLTALQSIEQAVSNLLDFNGMDTAIY
jgi:hypothetical protein